MTAVNELFRWGVDTLRDSGIESPELDTRLLLEHVFQWKPNSLQLHMNASLGEPDHAQPKHHFKIAISRRAADEPLAYIIETAFFCGQEYVTRPGVLIPRPETELLVDVAVRTCSDKGWANAEIWDVGTGTGCIGIEIARRLPESQVVLWEKSEDAAKICSQNLSRFGLSNVRLIHADFFSDEELRSRSFKDRPLVIVSNPPYIPIMEFMELPSTVRYFEPHLALNGGIDGLDYYRLLADPVATEAVPNALIVEVGMGQSDEVRELFDGLEGVSSAVFDDLQGIGRVVAGVFV